jgi:isoleucyl-tRNA synthetase
MAHANTTGNGKDADKMSATQVLATYTGRQLLEMELKYCHPLLEDRVCPVVGASYVTLDDGTGLVHTAPGHGIEDYGTGLKNGLEIYCPVQANGTFDDTAPAWLRGVNVWKANPMIVDYLTQRGKLLLAEEIVHSYPHDWRSMTPTIFRATEQWFIGVDRPARNSGSSLRDMAMDTCRRDRGDGGVDFVPAWGRNRIAGMLESRPDWCISRQRAWGLPIPAFYNAQGKPLLTPRTIRAVAEVVAKQGSDAWFKLSPAQLLQGYDPYKDHDLENPEEFEVASLTAGRDIFDVWFESGSSWFAACIQRGLVKDIPIDLYLEGSDQHRGWFQLSLLPALGSMGRSPFATVVTHGFIVDEQGRKMSKSLGNTINVIDQLAKRGADILRLWIASANYQDDVRCSESLIAQAEDGYRKIRNTLRFLIGSCYDFDPAVNATEPADHSIDRWMVMQLHQLIHEVRAAYDAYEFHRAARTIYEFCTVQASSIYMSAVKDRLYCESPDANRRRATQTVMHEMLLALTKLLAPILPHTCDEVWSHIPNRPKDEPDNVALALLPEVDEDELALAQSIVPASADQGMSGADKLAAGPAYMWSRLMELRDLGLVELEKLRNAGVKNSLDAEAVFQVAASNEPLAIVIETYIRELEDMLGVGYASVERVPSLPEGVEAHVHVRDTREKYKRCARSWKRRPDVGSDAQYPELSARDAGVMKEIKQK